MFEWDDRLNFGDQEIDSDHKTLFALANCLEEEVDPSRERINRALDLLDSYAKRHFAHEEALMQRIGYPDIEAHKAQHQRLISMLIQCREKFERREISRESFGQFMRVWLTKHILTTDKAVADHMRDHKPAADQPVAKPVLADAPRSTTNIAKRYLDKATLRLRFEADLPKFVWPHVKVGVLMRHQAEVRSLRQILARMGANVVDSDSVFSFMSGSSDADLDMLLVDFDVEPMGGTNLVQFIRSEEKIGFRKAVVIMISSDTNLSTVQAAINCGANAMLARPYNMEHIKRQTEKFLTQDVQWVMDVRRNMWLPERKQS